MPIYAYKCTACGHAKDVLQKVSDPVLSVCPACGADEFAKQLTAAGFQLKGSGWYVTDFRDGGSKKAKEAAQPQAPEPAAGADKPADKPTAAPAAAKSTETPAAPAKAGASDAPTT